MDNKEAITLILELLSLIGGLLILCLLIPLASATTGNYYYLRLNSSNNALAGAYQCGYNLLGYHKTSESGCNSYTGWACNTSILGITDTLTLIYAQPYNNSLNYSAPIWAHKNTSCIYRGVDIVNGAVKYYRAWKVQSSAGQMCTMQNRWDYYVYSSGFTTETVSLNLTVSTPVNFELNGTNCTLYQIDIPVIPPVPPVINNTAPTYPNFFNVDFTQKVNLILLVFFLILFFILFWLKKFLLVAVLLIILGFVLLFSGIALIFCAFFIILGCIFAFFGSKA